MRKEIILCEKDKMFGQPSLKARRLTVYDIVTKVYYEVSIETAVDDYEITLEDAKAALSYCKSLNCKEDENLLKFCDGCILRTLQDGWNFNRNNFVEVIKNGTAMVISKDKKEIFFGTMDEFENSEFGKVTWLIAEEILNSIGGELK